MKVKIINTQRNTFVGFDDNGNRVIGTGGDELSVPKDLSQQSANKGIKEGFLVQVEVKKPVKKARETATKSKRSTATKG